MKLLRDEHFQKLLVNYPRPKQVFVSRLGDQDNVSSEWLIRDGLGKEYKPEDYLAAFARFVQEQRRARSKPSGSCSIGRGSGAPKPLRELRRQARRSAASGSPSTNLQKAHELRYHKALVDIISMVKHAADEDEPAAHRRRTGRRGPSRSSRAGRRSPPSSSNGSTASAQHLVAEPVHRPEDFDACPFCRRRAVGCCADQRGSTEQLLETLTHRTLNEAIAA